MNVFIWSFVFLIGVYDAREHRIPNLLLIILFLISVLETLYIKPDLTFFSGQCLAFIIVFFISFLCFLSGWMAPGDVKLLSVVSFVTGFNSLLSLFFWVGVSSVLLGIMYWMINHVLFVRQRFWLWDLSIKLMGAVSNPIKKSVSVHSREKTIVMPFAPVVVLGMALNQYMMYSV